MYSLQRCSLWYTGQPDSSEWQQCSRREAGLVKGALQLLPEYQEQRLHTHWPRALSASAQQFLFIPSFR
ncbi:hypothetical protein Y1Q_0003223 [Alligator mississippiensis]|uniref:Uncharacterized protein n=1 Tax=Alligator mississippiensis TaxID=8496 RepID=A0A151ME98_ALLMI|nr:hypothetical protein Y1Q_0003223 [Alligator mississippiensis]